MRDVFYAQGLGEIILAAHGLISVFRFVDGELLAHRLGQTLPRFPTSSE
ncbi:hypothetical protein [Bradyrhizobium sp. B120]